MSKSKEYANGVPVVDAGTEFKRAQSLLVKAGLYRQMGNFGPYYPNKKSLIYTVVETLVIEDVEFTIVESEVMSFSLGSMSMSKPYMQKEAWFQPVAQVA